MAQTPCDLAGLGVLVTRPAHQADGLCQLIQASGGAPLAFPALEIAPPADPEQAAAYLRRLADFQIAIFISPNAVSRALALLAGAELPPELQLAAVGKGTANALAAAGYSVDITPNERFDSEALLQSRELQAVGGKRVLIVRGVGGRALLGDTLTERGAQVSYAEVYQRRLPECDPTPLLERWDDVDVVVATSGEILDNLWHLLGSEGRARL
ncbi:MAG: uroporphyrinogen-III synthase, partial [Chromatiales bacterium]|nr:uroporphyrinogen-III synthase [Chromatiales bacterium]